MLYQQLQGNNLDIFRSNRGYEMDLSELSLKDLKKLEKDLVAAIDGFGDREKSKARAAVEKLVFRV